MRQLLRRYDDQLSVDEIAYEEATDLAAGWIAEKPAMYVPGWPFCDQGPLEVVAKSYWAILSGEGKTVRIDRGGGERSFGLAEPFDSLREFDYAWQTTVEKPRAYFAALLSFDLYRFLEELPVAASFYQLPDYYICLPAEACVINHGDRSAFIINAGEGWLPPTPENFRTSQPAGETRFRESRESYLAKIANIQELIRQGEVYQVNYTTCISRALPVSGFSFFRMLYDENPAPFSCYLNLPGCEIVSNSPERFLSVSGRMVITEPIKGTVRRGTDPADDDKQKQLLLASGKDAAELSMIVDLLRNDLSKTCQAGSVVVESHRRLESFSNVHHLVSTVAGRLRAECDPFDVIRGAFPGGSISGCPKIAALKYIAELEQHQRSFYTGNLLLRFPGQQLLDSSILIRTGIVSGGQIHFQVGGGIVIDSEPDAEYDECLAKADSFLKVINRIENDLS